MFTKLVEAEQLMQRALALLDDAGELRAAPHLDLALHELGEVLQASSGRSGPLAAS